MRFRSSQVSKYHKISLEILNINIVIMDYYYTKIIMPRDKPKLLIWVIIMKDYCIQMVYNWTGRKKKCSMKEQKPELARISARKWQFHI